MIIFHSRQSGYGRRVRKKAYAGTLQIHITNCAAKLHSHFHEARKIVCNNLSSAVQAHVMELPLYAKQAEPLRQRRKWRNPRCNAKPASEANIREIIGASCNPHFGASLDAAPFALYAANNCAASMPSSI
jgi:hypothetical protein